VKQTWPVRLITNTSSAFIALFHLKSPPLLRVAGPVWQDNKPTGFGVKLLVDYLLNAKKAK
jgi:hypothetical protein